MSLARTIIALNLSFCALFGCSDDAPRAKLATADTLLGNDSPSPLDPAERARIDSLIHRDDTSYTIRDHATGRELRVDLHADMLELHDGARLLDTVATIDLRGDTYGQTVGAVGGRFIINEAVWRGNSATGELHVYGVRDGAFYDAVPHLLSNGNHLLALGEYSIIWRFEQAPPHLTLTERYDKWKLEPDDDPDLFERQADSRNWSRRHVLRLDTSGVLINALVNLDVVPVSGGRALGPVTGRYPGLATQGSTDVYIDGRWYSVRYFDELDFWDQLASGDRRYLRLTASGARGDTLVAR